MVTTGVVVLDEPLGDEPEPHPEAVNAETDTMTASSTPQRRRRGIVNRRVHASVRPELAASQEKCWNPRRPATLRAFVVLALLWKAEIVRTVVEALAVVMLTGLAEKVNCEANGVSAVAVRLTVPVKPLDGVRVRVTPVAELPDRAELVAWHGVKEKSGLLLETTSITSAPLEPANVPFPE